MTKTLQTLAYLALRPALQPVMRLVLKRRLKQGKEDPARIGEKMGQATQARPEGRLVWMHAVGLGEVLALRPLILQMQAEAPDLHFLITSTAKSSAGVIGANLPPRCQHQFLPLDGPDFIAAFLDHWQPSLAIWSEQDIWPGAIHDTAQRNIPQAWVNARMNAESLRKRLRMKSLYADALAQFQLIAAQDPGTAGNLETLGAPFSEVTGSLKPAAEPLGADPAKLAQALHITQGRRVWVGASTHAGDEPLLLAAQKELLERDPSALLILAPRLPARADEIIVSLKQAGLNFAQRSKDEFPGPATRVWLADSFGELGIWYRLASVSFVGNSFNGQGGHNPWEPLCLGLPVLHGPDVANFSADYRQLDELKLARELPPDPEAIALAILAPVDGIRGLANSVVAESRRALMPLARKLLALMEARP